MSLVSIRGAITVSENSKEEILKGTKKLLEAIIKTNSLNIEDIVSISFTATRDLTKVYPAVAARELGITRAALMCLQEMYVEDSLEKCIRVKLDSHSSLEQKDQKHIYLEGARSLRPDLGGIYE